MICVIISVPVSNFALSYSAICIVSFYLRLIEDSIPVRVHSIEFLDRLRVTRVNLLFTKYFSFNSMHFLKARWTPISLCI